MTEIFYFSKDLMKHQVLLIEDDPFLSEMYVKKLEEGGFEVKLAITAEAGFREIESQKPDLILLDIVLPKMDGFEFLRTFFQKKEYKDIPVIILSNVGQKEEIQKGIDLGAKDYIVKAHFTPSEIVQKVKEMLKTTQKPSKKNQPAD